MLGNAKLRNFVLNVYFIWVPTIQNTTHTHTTFQNLKAIGVIRFKTMLSLETFICYLLFSSFLLESSSFQHMVKYSNEVEETLGFLSGMEEKREEKMNQQRYFLRR